MGLDTILLLTCLLGFGEFLRREVPFQWSLHGIDVLEQERVAETLAPLPLPLM